MVYPKLTSIKPSKATSAAKNRYSRRLSREGISPDVKDAVLAAADIFRANGASVETFKMPIVKYAIPAYYIIACAEACSNLSRYDGIKYGYSSPTPTRLWRHT